MSLINKMLHNLDDRERGIAAPEALIRPDAVRIVKPQGPRWTVTFAWIVASLLLGGVGTWWLFGYGRPAGPAKVERVVQARPLPITAAAPTPDPAPPATETSATTPVATAVAEASQAPSLAPEAPINDGEARQHAETLKTDETPVASVAPDAPQSIELAEAPQPLPLAPREQEPEPNPPALATNADGQTTTGVDESVKLVPEPVALETEGMEALRAGRIQTGLSQLRRALELNPRLVMARVSLAKQLAHMKQTDEAIEILSEGLMLMPTNTWLTRELATLWRRAGNVEGAYELLRAALPYAKGNANYHAAFAQAAQDRRDCSTAVKHYRIALESKNWQAEWRTRLADCLYESGDRAGAEAEYVSALKLRNLPPEQRARAERKLAELR